MLIFGVIWFFLIGYILIFQVPFKIELSNGNIRLKCGIREHNFAISKLRKVGSFYNLNLGFKRSFVGYLIMEAPLFKKFFLIPITKDGYRILDDIREYGQNWIIK